MGQALFCAFISKLEDAYQIDSERLLSPCIFQRHWFYLYTDAHGVVNLLALEIFPQPNPTSTARTKKLVLKQQLEAITSFRYA